MLKYDHSTLDDPNTVNCETKGWVIPTRCVCPVIVLTGLELSVSQIRTNPLFVPTARWVPL